MIAPDDLDVCGTVSCSRCEWQARVTGPAPWVTEFARDLCVEHVATLHPGVLVTDVSVAFEVVLPKVERVG